MLCATFLPQNVYVYLQPLLRNAPRNLQSLVWKNAKYGPFPRSRSFKVTDFGNNRKLLYDFLLVINNNLPPILHRFGDTAFQMSKIAVFGYPSCV